MTGGALSADAAWPAPAKLNLFLHITGRREDGYHELQTLFQFLDYGDQLTFDVRADGVVQRIAGPDSLGAEDDLCVKAARALQRVTQSKMGVNIDLLKRLPIGGGLGGGSSDAATTLVALNALWNTGLSVDQLAGLGLELGADVPVFVRGYAAWAEGVGESLLPINDERLKEPWYLVITPDCEVSTAEVFNAPALTRDCPPIKIADLFEGRAGNVCLPVVRKQYPKVAEALDWLNALSQDRAKLTGTGASVFAEFPGRQAAWDVKAQLPDEWRGFVARGMNRSPLLERLKYAAS